MTVRVTKSAKTSEDGSLQMKNAMICDYQGVMPPKNDIRRDMCDEYVSN